MCGCQNKQRLFSYTALTAFITGTKCVYCAVRAVMFKIIPVKQPLNGKYSPFTYSWLFGITFLHEISFNWKLKKGYFFNRLCYLRKHRTKSLWRKSKTFVFVAAERCCKARNVCDVELTGWRAASFRPSTISGSRLVCPQTVNSSCHPGESVHSP